MSTFDPQAILDAVDTGSGSEPWTFYRARKSWLLDQGCIISAQSLMMIFFASVLVASSIGLYFGGPPDAGTRIYALAFIVAGLVCGIVALVLGWGATTLLRQMRTVTSQMIVLTPEGFVARTGQRPNRLLPDSSTSLPALEWFGTSSVQIHAAAYDQLQAILLVVEPSLLTKRIKLNLTFKRPHEPCTVQWFIDPRFGPVDVIAQSIIKAHARYAAQHAAAQ